MLAYCGDHYSVRLRRLSASAGHHRLDSRHHNLRPWMQLGEIQVRVVLLYEPNGQFREALGYGPHRIAAASDIDLGAHYAVRGEVARLQGLVILTPLLLELLMRHPVEVQVHLVSDDHRLAVAQSVELTQLRCRYSQP